MIQVDYILKKIALSEFNKVAVLSQIGNSIQNGINRNGYRTEIDVFEPAFFFSKESFLVVCTKNSCFYA